MYHVGTWAGMAAWLWCPVGMSAYGHGAHHGRPVTTPCPAPSHPCLPIRVGVGISWPTTRQHAATGLVVEVCSRQQPVSVVLQAEGLCTR